MQFHHINIYGRQAADQFLVIGLQTVKASRLYTLMCWNNTTSWYQAAEQSLLLKPVFKTGSVLGTIPLSLYRNGWQEGHPACKKTGCWVVDGDNLAGASRLIAPVVTTILFNKIQNGDILVLASPGPHEKWLLKWREGERPTTRNALLLPSGQYCCTQTVAQDCIVFTHSTLHVLATMHYLNSHFTLFCYFQFLFNLPISLEITPGEARSTKISQRNFGDCWFQTFYGPDALPVTKPTAWKYRRDNITLQYRQIDRQSDRS